MNASPIRVLLIDDEPAQVWLVRDQLLNAPGPRFDLNCRESLVEGIAELAAQDYQVLLLDLSLPDSLGTATFARIHAQFPALPVVVLTSLEDEELGGQLVQAGAQDYLVKGQVQGVSLARTIRYAIERKAAEVERERLIGELKQALAEVKTLSGLIPICARCKKVRDDRGFWSQVEAYVQRHSRATFSHGLCPDCVSYYSAEAGLPTKPRTET